MRSLIRSGLILISLLAPPHSTHAAGAIEIRDYQPGLGFATEFGSGFGYTNPIVALGEPTRFIPGDFGGPVNPFSPPYLRDQLVSIGTNGSLTVRLEVPAVNHPQNPYGIDFLIFGGAAFIITNGNYSGGGITDGSTFSGASGPTRVYVSNDDVHYFLLDPARAPSVEGLFPTDSTGDFNLPVDPSLRPADFAGRGLDNIRSLYNGSGGGAGFDLSWAVDPKGLHVFLTSAQFIRIVVLDGRAEIDALTVVSPPASGNSPLLSESFTTDPAASGWRTHGDPSLFRWLAESGRLAVTWDSRRTNSFLWRPIGRVLDPSTDFEVSFALSLESVQVGIDPSKPYTFQIALGLANIDNLFDTNLFRGTGINAAHGPRNMTEFAYFPDSGFGATVSPSIISSNNQFATTFAFPIELTPNDRFDVTLAYSSAQRRLVTTMKRNNEPFGSVNNVTLDSDFVGFHVDAIAIASYSDAGQDPEYAGSVLAQGWVDDLVVRIPSAPVQRLVSTPSPTQTSIEFDAAPGWTFLVERTHDFNAWTAAGSPQPQPNGRLHFTETRPTGLPAFYRIRADKQ